MPALSYNTTNLTNAHTIVEQITELNALSGGVFIASVLFAIWIVLFISSKNQGVRVSLLGVSFIMSIISTLAWYLGWVAGYIVMIPIVATMFGIFMIKLYD